MQSFIHGMFFCSHLEQKLWIEHAACLCFHRAPRVICYRNRLRRRAALIVGQRMKVVATVTRWATIFPQTIVWMKASVWIAPTMQTECWNQRYFFFCPLRVEGLISLLLCWLSFGWNVLTLFWSKKCLSLILYSKTYIGTNALHTSINPPYNVSWKRVQSGKGYTFLTIDGFINVLYPLPFGLFRVCWRLSCSLSWSILGALLVVITMPTLSPSVMASGTVSMINMLARSVFGFG